MMMLHNILKKKRDYDDEHDREYVRHWLMMGNDLWHKTQMPISINAVARCVGGDKDNIRKRILLENSDSKSEALCQKIGHLIQAVEERRLVFFKTKSGIEHHWLEPINETKINPLSTEAEWSVFARCKVCQKNKFMPVVMHGKNHALCYQCIPPSQYKALGATLLKKNLIQNALQGTI